MTLSKSIQGSPKLGQSVPAKHGGEFASKMVVGFKKLDPAVQKAVRRAFSKFSREAVEKLWKTEHIVRIRPGKPGIMSGLYENKGTRAFDSTKPITIWAHKDDPESCEWALIHEMVHASDHVRDLEENGLIKRFTASGGEKLFSRSDPELKRLHREYRKRSLPALGKVLADKVDLNQGKGEVSHLGHNYKWKLKKERFEVKETRTAISRYAEAAGTQFKKALLCGLGTALGVGIALSGTPLIGLAIAAPLAVLGGQQLHSVARSVGNERDLVGHKSQALEVGTNRLSFELDPQLGPQDQITSLYATTQRQTEEYLAETKTHYLFSQQSREKLRELDPEGFHYCDQEWNLSPRS